MSESEISDVTDTALWVATYRAEENERRDALFKDTFASLLIGERGPGVAKRTQGSRYTAWSVIIRTCIIDQFLQNLISQEIDTVINLGAGLDTRPYRLDLPQKLRWIEVDFPKIIDLKNDKLNKFRPTCLLERVKLDLSSIDERNDFFQKINRESRNVLILTEGVIPYLSNTEAASLASSLYDQNHFTFWITEYYSPEILNFLRTPKRLNQMEKSPFLFYPEDWFGFFKKYGWHEVSTKYFGEESNKLGRMPPLPGWLKAHGALSDEEKRDVIKRYLGYSLYQKKGTI